MHKHNYGEVGNYGVFSSQGYRDTVYQILGYCDRLLNVYGRVADGHTQTDGYQYQAIAYAVPA